MEYLKGHHNTIRTTEEDHAPYTRKFRVLHGLDDTPLEAATRTLRVAGLVSFKKPANIYYIKRLYDWSKIGDILAAVEIYTGKPHKACQCWVNGYSAWKGDYFVIRRDKKRS